MPMMVTTCRFEEVPSEEELRVAIGRYLGPTIAKRNPEDIWTDGPLVHLTSMSGVALVYAKRACVDLGGVPCTYQGTPRTMNEWPTWSEKPWTTYPWWKKLVFSLSPYRL